MAEWAGGQVAGWVGGWSSDYSTPSWLHLASLNLPDSQLSWESKMEPKRGNKSCETKMWTKVMSIISNTNFEQNLWTFVMISTIHHNSARLGLSRLSWSAGWVVRWGKAGNRANLRQLKLHLAELGNKTKLSQPKLAVVWAWQYLYLIAISLTIRYNMRQKTTITTFTRILTS